MIYVLYGIIAIVAIIVILYLFAPKVFNVERSIIINKPLAETFDFLKYTKNQDHWSPWKKKDPNMVQSYEGTDGEVGFIARWEGNKEVGTGEQEILEIIEHKTVKSQLRFFKPWKSQSDAHISVEQVSEKETKVIWGFSGENKGLSSIFFLFFNMDKSVGKDFEEGLDNLKTYLEQ